MEEKKLTDNEKIESLEKQGIFDVDIWDDPEELELLPNKVDYLQKKLKTKILTAITLKKGEEFFEKLISDGIVVIDKIVGSENLDKIQQSGAIVTCNHFAIYDSYFVQKSLNPILPKKRLYKVIKEGNYTNPPPQFKTFMRYGLTLPLSRNAHTMKKFINAVSVLLAKGNKILIYPEQALWPNYRKPRPFKNGALRFAKQNNVPVLPVFVTMEDSDKKNPDGSIIQKHTIHILPPIYPDESLSVKEDAERMKNQNYDLWVKTYEEFYGKKLKYLCDKEKK